MWKKIRIPLLILIILSAAVLFFSLKIDFLAAPVRIGVHKATGENVRVGRVEYRLFNRFTVRDVELGDFFRCRAVTVSIDPARIIMSPRHPLNSLAQIHFSSPRVVLTPSFFSLVRRLGKPGPSPRPSRLTYLWEDGVVILGKERIEDVNGRVVSGTSAGGAIAAAFGGHHLSARFQSRSEKDQTTGSARVKIAGPDANVEANADFIRRREGILTATADISRLSWKAISAGRSTFRLNSSPRGFSFLLDTPAGTCGARGPSSAHFSGRAFFRLDPLITSSTGTASSRFTYDEGAFNCDLNIDGAGYRSFDIGSLKMSLKGAYGSSWKAEGEIQPGGYRFNGELSPSMALLAFLEKGKGSGMLMGRLKPLSLNLAVTGLPMENTPLLSSIVPSLKGTLNAEGAISSRETRIQARGERWEAGGTGSSGWTASLLQTGGSWFFKGITSGRALQVNCRFFSDGQWDAAAILRQVPIDNVMVWTGISAAPHGIVSGDISYASRGNGKAKFQLKNVQWPGGSADSAVMDIALMPDRAELVSCDIRSGGGSIGARGSMEKAKGKPLAFAFDLNFNKYPFYGRPASGAAALTGTLFKGLSNFAVRLNGKDLAWGPWAAKELAIPLNADSDRLEIQGFKWDRMARGNVSFARNTRVLDGEIFLSGVPVENLTDQAKGDLSGKLSIRGDLSRPSILYDYSAEDLYYRGVPGKASGTLFLNRNAISTPRTTLSVGAGTVIVNGSIWPKLSAAASVKDVPLTVLQAAGAGKDDFKGTLSGTVDARGTLKDPRLTADITGNGIRAGSLAVNDLASRFTLSASSAAVDSFSARLKDAEFRVAGGSSVDFRKRTFYVKTDWRNINTGPAVLFGALSFAGSWKNGKDREPVVWGTLTTDNFWINQYHAVTASIGLRYRCKTLTLEPVKGQPLSLTGAADLDQQGSVALRDIVLSREGRRVEARGTIGSKKWDVRISARKADAGALGEIFDLPVSLTGDIDADITGRGSVNAPDLGVSLSVTNGSIGDLPFDMLSIRGTARGDDLVLEEARMTRKNKYSAVASGTAPFYLTRDIRKRVLGHPIDLSFRLEQGTLDLLTFLTGDIRSGAGKVNAQAHVTGTLARPLTNGFIRVSGGELSGRRYFSRISGMDADLLWKDTDLEVRELSGKIGPGRLNVSGTIGFDGFVPSRYNLSFKTEGRKGIAVSVPELPIPSALIKTQDWDIISNLSHGEPRVDITFSGPASHPVLAGWIELENSRFTYPSLAKPGEGDSILDPIWPKMSWDLELRSGKNTWYDNELVSVMIQGGIRLTGRGLVPWVHGKVEAMRGTINYLGTEFQIKQAHLEIVKDTAYLEGEASTDIYESKMPGQTDTIQMFIDKSEIGKITPRFVSKGDPDLTPEQALARATGINPERYSSIDRDYMLRQQLIRLFDSTLTTPLARTLLRKSGLVDTFRVKYVSQEPIKPLNPGSPTLTELLYGTRYSLEKYLTTQMLFGYSMTFDQLQNKLDLRHELELSYRLNRGLFVRGSYELDTSKNPFRQYDRRITLEQQLRFDLSRRRKKKTPAK